MKVLVTLVVALLAGSVAYGQAGTGAKYGTRDPVTCKSKKEPAKGGPTAEQAAMYWRCDKEGTRSGSDTNLYLFENVKLEVGKARPFQASDQMLTDADPSQPVYPVRGMTEIYQCNDPSRMTPPAPGHNCNFTPGSAVTGACYKTAFGDWRCELGYEYDFRKVQRNIEGPK